MGGRGIAEGRDINRCPRVMDAPVYPFLQVISMQSQPERPCDGEPPRLSFLTRPNSITLIYFLNFELSLSPCEFQAGGNERLIVLPLAVFSITRPKMNPLGQFDVSG